MSASTPQLLLQQTQELVAISVQLLLQMYAGVQSFIKESVTLSQDLM